MEKRIAQHRKRKKGRKNKETEAKPTNLGLICEMCSKPIEGQPTTGEI
jgi:hypothetical protein